VLLGCLMLIPLGLPGTWGMMLAGLAYDWLTPGTTYGFWSIILIFGLAIAAEGLELVLAKRYTERTGGSNRAGWGALIGSLVGAVVGVPVFLIGSVIGAFLGAFIGAFVMEWSVQSNTPTALRVATGALVGRVVATGMKLGVGAAIAAWLLVLAARGALAA
jgi:uncharacterized protein YqgC (DUF456 family)